MKLHRTPVLTLLLAGAMLLNLAACGKDQASSGFSASEQTDSAAVFGEALPDSPFGEVDFGYINTPFLSDLKLSKIAGGEFRGGQLYLFGETSSDLQPILLRFSPESSQLEPIPLPEVSGASSSYVMSAAISPDGQSYWVLVSYSSPADSTSEAAGYSLLRCDMQGNQLDVIRLSDFTSTLLRFYPQALYMEQDGSLLVSGDTAILRFSPEGSLLTTIDGGSRTILSLMAGTDGTVYVLYFDSERKTTELAFLEDSSISAPLELGSFRLEDADIYPGTDGCLLVRTDDGFGQLEPDTGVLTQFSTWVDCDVNPDYIECIIPGQDNELFVPQIRPTGSSQESAFEISALTRVPGEHMPKREVLTFGSVSLDTRTRDQIISFNRSNDQYRIIFLNYGNYNTDTDSSLGAQRLLSDVLAGNSPDLFTIPDEVAAQRLIAAGALADLWPLIQEDDSIAREDLLSAPLQNYSNGDALYAMPLGFTLEVLCASTALTEEKEAWTISEMAQIVSNLRGTPVMKHCTRTEFLQMMLPSLLPGFVDYENDSCSFDSDDFRSLLEIASALPADGVALVADDSMLSDEIQQLSDGQLLLLAPASISDYHGIRTFYSIFNTDGITPIGFPNAGGQLGISVDAAYAVSSESTHQDVAWSFIRSLLSESTGEKQLPVSRSALEAVLSDAIGTDTDDPEVSREDSYWSGLTEYTVEPITPELAEDFMVRCSSAVPSGFRDDGIMNIVTELAEGFFNGSESLETVSAQIQERVSQYLSGQD